MACVILAIDGPLFRQTTVYTFMNGQIDDVFPFGASGSPLLVAIQHAATCDKFTYVPFPELRRRRQ